MTDQMIQEAYAMAKKYSTECGLSYVVSNGEEIHAVTFSFLDEVKEKGYWVAAIFENGYQVDL